MKFNLNLFKTSQELQLLDRERGKKRLKLYAKNGLILKDLAFPAHWPGFLLQIAKLLSGCAQ